MEERTKLILGIIGIIGIIIGLVVINIFVYDLRPIVRVWDIIWFF